MFTGIITDVGEIKYITNNNTGKTVAIQTSYDTKQIIIGSSIACSGVCLTVIECKNNYFIANVSHETLSITTTQYWAVGTKINLEKSLRVGDEISGHFVYGHIDGLATISNIEKLSECYDVTMNIPRSLIKFIAKKGSVSLDGISLTVNEVNEYQVKLTIIPHTWRNTTLQYKRIGDALNVEIDILSRYIINSQ